MYLSKRLLYVGHHVIGLVNIKEIFEDHKVGVVINLRA
ncbi:hypothetical protein [Paraliobacillus sediminis]